MNFYELVFVVRQDLSSTNVDKITDDIISLLSSKGGSVVKTEYWGLRTLAYEIKNNRKGHYVFIGFQSGNDVLLDLDKKLKFNEDVIRFMTLNVPSIKSSTSPILQEKNDSMEDVINVTIN